MPYTIVDVVYGFPLTKKVSDAVENLISSFEQENEDEEEEFEVSSTMLFRTSEEKFGFDILYSGHGGPIPPGYLGVQLCEFDETADIAVSTLRLVPTEEEKKEVEAKVAKLPEAIRNALEPLDVYFIFSTS